MKTGHIHKINIESSVRRVSDKREFCNCQLGRIKKLVPLEIRFWRHVDRHDNTECWLWHGATDGHGYGRMNLHTWPKIHFVQAHVIAWYLATGEVAKHDVLHRCDIPLCVNPSHLFLGTQADNNRDMWRKGRGRSARGIQCSQAKLNDDIVRAIRLARSCGKGPTSLARKYHVSTTAIKNIINGRTWRHVRARFDDGGQGILLG